jgi:hypothetical protein
MNAAPKLPSEAAVMVKQRLITDALPGRRATATARRLWRFDSAGIGPTSAERKLRRKAKRTRTVK